MKNFSLQKKKYLNSYKERLVSDININKINNGDNIIEIIKNSLDSPNASLMNNNKILSFRKPLKKLNNYKIRKINSLLVKEKENKGSFPVCFSSMTNKKNFNNILNYKLKINDFKKYNFKQKQLIKNESILNNNKLRSNKLDINFKFSSPNNSLSTINVNINNINPNKNIFSRNPIKPQIKNFTNLLSSSQLNSFSKDYYSSLNNSSNTSNIYMGSPIKINKDDKKDIIRQKIYNKNQINLKKQIFSPLKNKLNENNINPKSINNLFQKKLFLDKKYNNKIFENNESNKISKNNNSNNNLNNNYNNDIIKNIKIPELNKNLFPIEKKDINSDSIDNIIKNISFNPQNINNYKGENLHQSMKYPIKSLFKKSSLEEKKNRFSVINKMIKFKVEKEPESQFSNIKINKNKTFKINLKNIIKNPSNNNNSFLSLNLQKNESNLSLSELPENQQKNKIKSSKGNKKKNVVRRKKRLMTTKDNFSKNDYNENATEVNEEGKNDEDSNELKINEEKSIYKNDFLKKLINPYVELVSRNMEKKLKIIKTKFIEDKNADIELIKGEFKQTIIKFKYLSKEEIKINLKKFYLNSIKEERKNKIKSKSYNDFNKNCELYIDKIRNSKKYFLLDINLISFLLKSMYLSSIFLPHISKNNSNDNNKLMSLKKTKNNFYTANKSKFRESKYDIEYVGTNSPYINSLIKKDLIVEEDIDEDNINEKDDYPQNITTKKTFLNSSIKNKSIIINDEDKNRLSLVKSSKIMKTLKLEEFSLLKLKEFFENQTSKSKSKKRDLGSKFVQKLKERNSEQQRINQMYNSIKKRRKSIVINNDDSSEEEEQNEEKKKEDEFYNYLRILIATGELDSFNEYFDSANKFFNINKKDEKGNTLLILAAIHGHNSIVKKLIEKGADINEKNNKGNTALHYAISQKYFSLADTLKNYGAKEDIRNKFGFTPWECIGKSVEGEIY